MTTITTRAQQTKVGTAARKVGGYRVLITLAAQKQRAGGQGAAIAKDKKTGAWTVVSKPKRKNRVLGKLAAADKTAKTAK